VLSEILDDALFEHSFRGGNMPRKGKGHVHFKHYTQHQDSVLCGYDLLPYGHICEVIEEFKQKYIHSVVGIHMESNSFERKK
jgi:hypothetical protein